MIMHDISNKEKYYTLSNYGELIKIYDHNESDKWYEIIDQASSLLNDAKDNGEIICLFRGEGRKMFGMKTGVDLDSTEHPKYDRFFVIGSKAKSYIEDKNNSIQTIRQFDCGAKISYIFDRLNALSNELEHREILKPFNNRDYLQDFSNILENMHDKKHQLIIENFYLAFIHTWTSSSEEMNAHSVLISSTRDQEVAKGFSENGFVISLWIKNPY
jgi:hypothetical protein